MSRRLPRAFVGTSAAALALVLAAPSVAWACDDGSGGSGGSSSDHSGSRSSAARQHDGQQQDTAKQNSAKQDSAKQDSDRSGDEGTAHRSSTAKNQGTTKDQGTTRTSTASRGSDHNPPGNNGTIKIEPFGTTDGNANHPHPGCGFRLQMFGFDTNQTGTITFVGQAPTKGAVTTQPLPGHQLLSNDAAGGGQDVDEHYDVTAASLGLTGTPAKQGFHIKVLVNADNAPGGAKQKVFWLSCPTTAAAPAAPATAGGAGTTSATGSGTAVSTQSLGSGSASSTGITGGGATLTTVPGTSGTTPGSATGATGFTGGSATAATTPAGAGVAAASTQGGGALPFTGLALGSLVAFALSAVGLGAFAVRAGRRRTAQL